MGLPKFLLAALLLLKAQEAGRLPRSCASAIARLKQTVWISTRHDISLGWSGCRPWLSIKWDLYLLDLFSTTECCVPLMVSIFLGQFNGKLMTSPKNMQNRMDFPNVDRRISTAININHYQNDPKWIWVFSLKTGNHTGIGLFVPTPTQPIYPWISPDSITD